MAIEIERKFLPTRKDFLIDLDIPKVIQEIDQTYLSITNNSSLRIRRIEQDGSYLYTMAYKSSSGIRKEEQEFEIDQETYSNLMSMSESIPLRKIRYKFVWEGYPYDVDMYEDYDLIIIEVEFESIEDATAFQSPTWLGDDVSGDKQYSNKKLWEGLQILKTKRG